MTLLKKSFCTMVIASLGLWSYQESEISEESLETRTEEVIESISHTSKEELKKTFAKKRSF